MPSSTTAPIRRAFGSDGARSPGRAGVVAVLAAAVVVRIAAVGVAHRAPLGEGAILLDVARNIGARRGMCVSDTVLRINPQTPPILRQTLAHWASVGGVWGVVPPNRPTAFLPPLYPMILSVVASRPGGLLAARMLGVILGSLTTVMAFDLARRWVPRAAVLTAALAVADPLAAFQSAEISTHQTAAFMAVLPVWVTSRARPGMGASLVVGALSGAAFLARPTAWLLVPLLAAARWRRDGHRGVVLLVLGAAAAVAPWVARNACEVGKPLLFPTNGGRNLWEFNNQKLGPEYEWSEPQPSRRLYDPIRRRHTGSLRRPDVLPFPSFSTEPEWERDRLLTARFVTFAMANPLVYAELVGVRITQMLALWPLHVHGAARLPFAAHSLALLVLSCVGTWEALRAGGLARAVALFVALFLALHALTAAGFVYRGMIAPFLALLGGYGASGLWERGRAAGPVQRAMASP